MIQLFDRVLVDAKEVRRTNDGYLVATPRVARVGIQLYSGAEMGRPQMDRVLVYRPEEEVFNKDALHSFGHRPVTNDHPNELVTADNWKKYSVGSLGGDIARDGDFVRVPFALMDSSAIKDFESGKREISFGYTCDIAWEPGITADGQAYDAIQRNIRGNHCALVDRARGGELLRLGDSSLDGIAFADTGLRSDGKKRYPIDRSEHIRLAWDHLHTPEGQAQYTADQFSTVTNAVKRAWSATIGGEPPSQETTSMADKSLVIDGITVTLNDTAAQVVQKLMDTSAAAIKAAQTAADEWKKKAEEEEKKAKDAAAVGTTTIANKDKEIAELTTKLKDAEVTPERLEAMAADRATLLGKAKAILGDKLDVKATSADIRKAAVLAHVGDAAKDFTADQMTAAFATIKVDSVTIAPGISSMRDAFMQPSVTDSTTQKRIDDAIAARDKSLVDAWKAPVGQA